MNRQTFTKIGYFVLGGMVATIGYIAGSMDSLIAQQDIGVFKKLHVEEIIMVGDITSPKQTYVGIHADDNTAGITVIHNRPKGLPVEASDAVAGIIASVSNEGKSFSMLNLRDNSNGDYKIYSYDKSPNNNSSRFIVPYESKDAVVVEVLSRQAGVVDTDVKIVSADVKFPNGKKVHVKFSNPQTTGMISLYDKIRIKAKGRNWEFIEHVP